MQVVYSRCCSLDVHKKVIAACVLLWEEGGRKWKESRRFGTMTRDLLAAFARASTVIAREECAAAE
jgi:hypothetical protein